MDAFPGPDGLHKSPILLHVHTTNRLQNQRVKWIVFVVFCCGKHLDGAKWVIVVSRGRARDVNGEK